jgi:hypothetical protein
MSILTATLASLTRWLGANPATQQDVVYSEASAKRALSRRAFLRSAGAVAAGVVLADQVAALADEGAAVRVRPPAEMERMFRELAERIKEYRPRGPVYMHPDDHAKLVELGYAPSLEPVRADDYIFLPGNARIAEWEKFYTDLAGETVATITAIDRSRGIITVDSAPAPVRPSLFADRFGVTLVRDGNV